MNETALSPIVVGVDGSTPALEAVGLAAAEAARRHRPLHIIHAWVWPVLAATMPEGAPLGSESVFRSHADDVVEEARTRAEKEAPGIAVITEVVQGLPAPVLLHRSRAAFLVVVGDRGLGGFTGLMAGSVAVQLATHGSCPVLVVRGGRRRTGPVVVGVDRSRGAHRALEFAADEAHQRGTELLVVHTWRQPPMAGPGVMMPLVYDVGALEKAEDEVLTDAIASVAEVHPDLPVRRALFRGAAARHLTRLSREAQLTVVGDRGHGGFAGLLLGSVSQHLIFHAQSPVIVLRNDGTGHATE
jgi:nucleotide-binding universal stress UspA family protein